MRISTCILMKNEENNIERCLESVKPFSDEIIIVDNGSTDHSVDIAKKYATRIINSPDTLVDEGRNKYLQVATGDWIFVIDADEFIINEQWAQVKQVLSKADSSFSRCELTMYHFYGDDRFTETKTRGRLFKNLPGLRYSDYFVHSSITTMMNMEGKQTLKLDSPIYHLDALVNNNKDKRTKYTSLLERQIKENPLCLWSQYVFLGAEYIASGKIDKCLEQLELVKEINYTEKENANRDNYCHLFSCYLGLIQGDHRLVYDNAQYLIINGTIFKQEAFLILMKMFDREGNKQQALKMAEEAINLSRSPVSLINYGLLVEKNLDQRVACFMEAIHKNRMLTNKVIHRKANHNNIYWFRNLLLDRYHCMEFHLAETYEMLENRTEYKYWADALEEKLH